MILLGGINFKEEISLDDKSGVLGRRTRGLEVRRMYSAKLEGVATGCMTVAMYVNWLSVLSPMWIN
jgi:hypothetical protein